MKIAIVGGGIFGTVIADMLSVTKHEIKVFEKRSDLFLGASGNSSNRLHLGFHYPRDLETAVQSLEGFKKFASRYPEACNFKFPCFYALSKNDSRTSLDSYLDFLQSANLKAKEFGVDCLSPYGFDTDSITRAWLTEEGVVDINVLKTLLVSRLKSNGVVIKCGTEISRISKEVSKWRMEFVNGSEFFDFVIIATYGVDLIDASDIEVQRSKSIYQATLILQAKISTPQFGITVVDGDFITVLPKGYSDVSLVYAPGPSVIAESESIRNLMKEMTLISNLERNSNRLKKRFRDYFPEIETQFINEALVTIRNIEVASRETDKRVSRIEELAPNLVSVRSGKLDHAVLIGQELVRLIQ